jgi:hypothetical protein
MTLVDWLQANAKRVVEEYSSIVRRNACWAAVVMLQCVAGHAVQRNAGYNELP